MDGVISAGDGYDSDNLLGSERPLSVQGVDLHVYVVPAELWQEHLQSALNQVISDTISAGFIRVMPDTTVFNLRVEIENQLGYDVIPQEFVFLRCVGRCFTRIKPKQENLLKVKNFIPPQAYTPELFVLESNAEIRAIPFSSSSSGRSLSSNRDNVYTSESNKLVSHKVIPPIEPNTIATQTGDDTSSRKTSSPSIAFSKDVKYISRSASPYSSSLSISSKESRDSKFTQTNLEESQTKDLMSRQKTPLTAVYDVEDLDDRFYPPLSCTPTQSHAPVKSRDVRQSNSVETQTNGNLDEDEQKALQEIIRKQKEDEARIRLEETKKQNQLREAEQRIALEKQRKEREEREEMKRRQERLKEDERLKEEERQRNEEKQREEQRKKKELQMRHDAAKRQRDEEKMLAEQRENEMNNLQKEIEELRASRLDKEKQREELLNKSRQLQTQMQGNNKTFARETWRKNYFLEKKKTGPLDEANTQIKRQLEAVHKRILSQMQTAGQNQGQLSKDSANGNATSDQIQARKLQQEMETFQERLETVKMKLTAEMKLRNQVDSDMRTLKMELEQRKSQMNSMKQTQRRDNETANQVPSYPKTKANAPKVQGRQG